MKQKLALFWVLGALCLLLSLGADAFAHPKYRKDKSRSHIQGQYLVEFARDASIDSHEFIRGLETEVPGISLRQRYSFSHKLFNGVSFEMQGLEQSSTDRLLKAIVDKDIVSRVYPNTESVHADAAPIGINEEVEPATVKKLLPHSLTQVDRVHQELNITGKGVLLCIIDSGIDYNHPAFGGGFGENYRVVIGSDTADNRTIPLDDCPLGSSAGGHGTHVAGIAAGHDASKSFVGVAPEAMIGFWKIFSCKEGSAPDDGFIKALTAAYDSGCEVLNLSLGQDNKLWSENPESVVIERLVEAGLPVIVASGNLGRFGAFTVSEPAPARKAMSVGSTDNAYYLTRLFEARRSSNPDQRLGPFAYNPEPSAFDLIPHGEVVKGYNSVNESACSNTTEYTQAHGKLVLLKQSSDCDLNEQVANVAKSGAIGALVSGTENAEPAGTAQVPIPIVTISETAGKDLETALDSNDTITLRFSRESLAQKLSTDRYVSEFTSIGPNADLDFHPTISGPGGSIFSTLPKYIGSWGVMSGTSMAAPYLTGAIALFIQAWKEKNQKVTPQFMFEQFQNYATQIKAGPLHSDMIDNPIRQGAGLVQVYDAIKATVHISPSQISFNDTASVKEYKTHVLNITNFGTESASYRLRNQITTGIAPYTFNEHNMTMTSPDKYFAKTTANVTFSPSDVTIGPGQSQQVTVHVDIPADQVNSTQHLLYGGYVHFDSRQDNHKSMTVPYIGIWGKQRDLPLLDKVHTSIINQQEMRQYLTNETYHMTLKNTTTYPQVYAHLYTPTAKLVWNLLDEHRKVIGKIAEEIYVDRSLIGFEPALVNFTGTYTAEIGGNSETRDVTSGQYKIQVSALKLFGDPQNTNHWDTWESGPVQVQ
ncbi:hypothetical protein DFQ28_000399 [Apophysomyces sp. BC1034]|nr:hypothetical protein DFQ30_008368 [Apophysomyces sp. BC1015]KAG0177991.1 hypothetical protein DFQ29_004101 [Apophysomyces sp. BC1021]KAG0191336.1 hypothetical protein DFQ28_000399 [Apophysomyces sp. BC1034]